MFFPLSLLDKSAGFFQPKELKKLRLTEPVGSLFVFTLSLAVLDLSR